MTPEKDIISRLRAHRLAALKACEAGNSLLDPLVADLAEAADLIERLRKPVEGLRDLDHTIALINAGKEREAKLEAALRQYGMHGPNCYPPDADGRGALCICGFTDALTALGEKS